MNSEDAYAALDTALQTRAPACSSDPRFTADIIPKNEQQQLKITCDRCDVALLCRRYAQTAKVKIGFWAGRSYSSQR